MGLSKACLIYKKYTLSIGIIIFNSLLICCTNVLEEDPMCIDGCINFELIDYEPSWSPDGKWIAYYHVDSRTDYTGIYRIRPDGSENTFWIPGGQNPAWSPDSKWLAYSLGAQIWITELEGDSSEQLTFEGRNFVYGLPELQKEKIENSKSVANPGCFATAIQLALLPLANQNLINSPVHISATTGSTGAGVGLSATSHFSWRNNNLSWYKPFTHQHLGEIHQSLKQLGSPSELYLIPQRGDFTRGIFTTLYTSFEGNLEEAKKYYRTFYALHPFTQISDQEVSLKSVINTNYCFIHLHKYQNKLLITSVIDNLVKGASGQAIQNTNLIMGWEENLGLNLKASVF